MPLSILLAAKRVRDDDSFSVLQTVMIALLPGWTRFRPFAARPRGPYTSTPRQNGNQLLGSNSYGLRTQRPSCLSLIGRWLPIWLRRRSCSHGVAAKG